MLMRLTGTNYTGTLQIEILDRTEVEVEPTDDPGTVPKN